MNDVPLGPRGTPNGDRGLIPAAADRLLRILAALPDRRDECLAVVNGFFGDALADQGSTLAIPMTLRSGTDVISVDHASIAHALPHATGHIALLVHGLMLTESVWDFPDERGTTYGTLLARDHGVTPLSLRYNTGRHVSTNGQELARLVRDLVAAWPVPVSEITLIGHSMGGLVVRSACHYASAARPTGLRRSWTAKTRRVVLIGVPNLGAPLEVFVNLTSAALWSLPIPATRLVGQGLDARSAGIRDLRFGALTDEDWIEQDPDTFKRPAAQPVSALRRAAYLIIAGSVTADPAHPFSRIFGDTLVTESSASGHRSETTDQSLFPNSTARMFPKVTHLALAHRPDIYDEINRWWP